MDGVRQLTRNAAIGAALFLWSSHVVHASGHGPLFGAATPTLGKGGWSVDQAWMGQVMDGSADSGSLLRTMISAGLTEKLQISGSLPVPLGRAGMGDGRMMAMMSGNTDFEALVGWRFQTRPVGEGARLESTVFVGGLVPLDSTRGGVRTSGAGLVSLTSGYASRSHYVWVGATHVHHARHDADRLPATTSFSVVYGYRPPAWRKDYPKPDLRFFVEAAGDITGRALHDGRPIAASGGRVALVGPTLLLLYKAYAISGGALFPVYQSHRSRLSDERARVGVNVTYFFWP
jgi:hypothetical protein